MMSATSLLLLALGAAFGIFLAEHRRYTLRRATQIDRAATLLKEHYAALSDFLNDPASPKQLQDLLLKFSDGICDEKSSIMLANHMLNKPPHTASLSQKAAENIKILNELRGHRSDLADKFHMAIVKGLNAMFLRWDETEKIWEDFAISAQLRTTSKQEQSKEVILATKIGYPEALAA
jgi:hypothetical protein